MHVLCMSMYMQTSRECADVHACTFFTRKSFSDDIPFLQPPYEGHTLVNQNCRKLGVFDRKFVESHLIVYRYLMNI